ncbi:hypothetical protein JL722_14696 [Aureococcus anophagefferens]|nr:hypothetical protein JL722_14696 [Aureococcus anophagefferens]
MDASLSEYATDPYASDDGGASPTSKVARFGLSGGAGADAPARRRRLARRRRRLGVDGNGTNATAAGGDGAVVVGIDIESLSLEKIIQKMIGANLTCDCGFVGTKTFLCKDNATILNNTCDGGPGSSVEAFCPIMVDTCSSFAAGANGSAGSWVPTCETVEQDDGSTSCRPAADFGISDEYGNVGDVYFSNLTSPPDLSRAVYVIYALAALIGACLFFHVYGNRLDRLGDAPRARARGGPRRRRPYEVPEGVQKMLDPALKRWHTGLCIDHPFYSYWFYHSHSAGRAGRAWFCGFEILMFLYSVAFHTNLVFPDVEDQCAAYATYTKCLGLKTYLRGKMDFGRWHLEPADLCEWDMCSQACFMAEPVIGDMSATYYFILAVMFVVLLPVVKIFEFMAEGYLMAPVPPAIAELCCCVAEHVEDHWTRAPAQAYMKHTNTKRELLKAQSRMFPGDVEEGDGDVEAGAGAPPAAENAGGAARRRRRRAKKRRGGAPPAADGAAPSGPRPPSPRAGGGADSDDDVAYGRALLRRNGAANAEAAGEPGAAEAAGEPGAAEAAGEPGSPRPAPPAAGASRARPRARARPSRTRATATTPPSRRPADARRRARRARRRLQRRQRRRARAASSGVRVVEDASPSFDAALEKVLAADGAELAAVDAEPPAAVDEAVRGAGDERARARVVVDFGAGHESKTVEPFLSPPPPLVSPPRAPEVAAAELLDDDGLLALAKIRAAKESEIPNFKGSDLGRFLLAKILDERGAAFAPPVASPVASDDEDDDAEDGGDDDGHAEEEPENRPRASLTSARSARRATAGPLVVEAVLMRSDEIRAQEACGATPGTRKRLREINDAFLAKWHGHLLGEWSDGARDAFDRHVEAVLAKRILRALDWHDAMAEDAEAYARERLDAAEEDGGAVDAESFRDALTRRKEATLVDHLRSEILTSTERTVFAVCSDRLLGVPLDPPDEPPASVFGLEKSRQWLTSVGISVGLYFAFIKPIVCMIVYVFIPGVVNGIVAAASRPLERRRFPFKTPLPDSSTAFLLQWHPELAGTPAAEHVLATLGKGEAPGTIDQRNRDERALTKAEVLGIHEDFVPSRSVVVTVAVVLASGLFQLNDDIQEVILEEVFCFTPMISGPIVGFIPLPESSVGKGGGISMAVGLIVIVLGGLAIYYLLTGWAALRAYVVDRAQEKHRKKIAKKRSRPPSRGSRPGVGLRAPRRRTRRPGVVIKFEDDGDAQSDASPQPPRADHFNAEEDDARLVLMKAPDPSASL